MRTIEEIYTAMAEAKRWGEPVAIRVGRTALDQIMTAFVGAPPSDALRHIAPQFEATYQRELRVWIDKLAVAARAWDDGDYHLWGLPIEKDEAMTTWALVVQSQTVFCPGCRSATPEWHDKLWDERMSGWIGCTHPWHDAIPSPARLIAAGDEAGTVA